MSRNKDIKKVVADHLQSMVYWKNINASAVPELIGFLDEVFETWEKSIIKEGLQNPIIIRKLDMVVITGNHRCWFAKKHGYSHISADFVND